MTAPKRPGLVRKLVLNDAGPEFDSVGIARSAALRKRTSAPDNWEQAKSYLHNNLQDQFPGFDADDWKALAETIWRNEDGRPVADYDKSLLRMSNDVDYDNRQLQLWPEFRIFRSTPTLLIRGENSRLMTIPIVETMRATLPSLTVLDAKGQGHVPCLDRDGLTQAVLEFLGR